MTGPRLTGGRCQCTVCMHYFGSERGFDRHRIGEVGSPDRRCLTGVELANANWVRDARGFWLQPDARRAGTDLQGASSTPTATSLPVVPP
jgi:hypothetical protein